MRFSRFPRARRMAPSKQRIAAAKRAIERETASVPLFPELAPRETPEERIARQDEIFLSYWQRLRDHQASKWRQARRQVYALPSHQRQQLINEWNTCGWPASPEYLLSFLRYKAYGGWWYVTSEDDLAETAFGEEAVDCVL